MNRWADCNLPPMAGDWKQAGEAFVELSLAARGSTARFRVEAIAPYLRLRDAGGVAAVINELLGARRECRRQSGEDDAAEKPKAEKKAAKNKS